jgi:DNA-binding NarL/FixJ family response regulator
MVVDDHPVFRDGLAKLLGDAATIEVVGTAADGKDAVRQAVELQPDVILMDLKMPGMNGIEATRQVVDTSPSIRVVVLTMMEDDASVFAAIRAGAHGYLLKGTEVDRIIDTVAFVAEGGSIFGPGIAIRAKHFLQANLEQTPPAPTTHPPPSTSPSGSVEPTESGDAVGERAVTPQSPDASDTSGVVGGQPAGRVAFPQLTERELELLDLIADGHDNTEIARTLTLSQKTVRNHVSNILAKVQLANRYRLIVDARDAGFGTKHADASGRS